MANYCDKNKFNMPSIFYKFYLLLYFHINLSNLIFRNKYFVTFTLNTLEQLYNL